MPLVSAREILRPGRVAFDVIQLEQLTAVIDGAQAVRSPVLLQISRAAVRYHGALAPIAAAALAAAKSATVPVALHFDHVDSLSRMTEVVELGFGSVLFRVSTSDLAVTREVVEYCHRNGVWVEAGLGGRVDPANAGEFAAATGVDTLAVGARDGMPDLDLISRLRRRTGVPLALADCPVGTDGELVAAVQAGIMRLTCADLVRRVFADGVMEYRHRNPAVHDPCAYLAAGRDRLAAEVSRILELHTGS
ncbi:class II fructose-bisphosphate aldolase [Saccharothrix sp. AJ9571]|nr:class II fructose-bisphosphate aldolase [Saccharothrix sp. AJ9571]